LIGVKAETPSQALMVHARRPAKAARAPLEEFDVNKLAIPHDAIVFVGDGRKALFLRNDGDEKFPNLKTEQVFADENPPTHEQGTDKPGSAFARASTHRRSSVEQTDWHHLEEHRFVERVAAALESVVRSPRYRHSSLPPRRGRSPTCAGPSTPM
jgi:protein required for attachment to host cells